MMEADVPYVELAVTSNFSFLRGASHPKELVRTAHEIGHQAVGIADRNSFAGVVRAHAEGRELGFRTLTGVRLITVDGFETLCYPKNRAAYGRLCDLLTTGNLRAAKGECDLTIEDILDHGEGQIFIVMPPDLLPDEATDSFFRHLTRVVEAYPGTTFLAGSLLYRGWDRQRLRRLAVLADQVGAPLVATNDVYYHEPERRVMQDVVTCIREHCRIHEAGFLLHQNAERFLKPPHEMARLFADYPEAVTRTVDIARSISFSLDELRYEYPDEGQGSSPQEKLIKLTFEGARRRFPDGIPEKVRKDILHELFLINRRSYAPYFLTVQDLVRFAESRNILCQGRGSAANSVVCYCLRVTSVDPTEINLLFERFVSEERNEPPDIDVDFEHERREEVIQYIYEKHGRDKAGIAATVITYRARSAIREVGKVMGLSEDVIAALSGTIWGWSSKEIDPDHVREIGLDPEDRTLMMAIRLACEIIGFPRHLSQHVGGFVMTRGPLRQMIPIANAAMEDRTFVEWDKDDLDTLGILKVDVLALGMLTCIARSFKFLENHYQKPLNLAAIPPDDKDVYDMIQEADTVGVFQIESRAQMSMLPRLRPENFYDLVIEVAIVRPGPIQGDMVHPYLRRRDGIEDVEYPKEELKIVLEKTLGVPLFQEQAMQIAIVAAGFTPAESDRLRRAMATFRHHGEIHHFREKFINGMIDNGYEPDFAERCFKQIEGFSDYGFPESHAASFALLVYISAWIKCHYPDVFLAGIMNSQPMGFYAPAQLVRDARDHGVTVLPPDINHSNWDCTLEPLADEDHLISPPPCRDESGIDLESQTQLSSRTCCWTHNPSTQNVNTGGMDPGLPFHSSRDDRERGNKYAVRLGLRQIKGLSEKYVETLVEKRGRGYDSVRDLWLRTGLDPSVLERLAHADCFRSIGLDRRDASWAVRGLGAIPLPLFMAAGAGSYQNEAEVLLPTMPIGEHVVHDYGTLRLSLKAHPMELLRDKMTAKNYRPTSVLKVAPADQTVRLAGIILVRQRPGTAQGVIFVTLEDETGIANLIIWPKTFEKYRKIVMGARLIGVRGRVQREGIVIHVLADELVDLSSTLHDLSRDDPVIEKAIARADEVKKPGADPREIKLQRALERRYQKNKIVPRSRDFH